LIVPIGPLRCFATISSVTPRSSSPILGPVQEHHDVGVLLDRPAVAQVREPRLAAALLLVATELRQQQDRDLQFLRQRLQRRRDRADRQRAVLVVASVAISCR
jgi:hypothetical protein